MQIPQCYKLSLFSLGKYELPMANQEMSKLHFFLLHIELGMIASDTDREIFKPAPVNLILPVTKYLALSTVS